MRGRGGGGLARRRQQAWSDFMQFVDRHQQSNWIFRGVGDAQNHRLIPKVGRDRTVYDVGLFTVHPSPTETWAPNQPGVAAEQVFDITSGLRTSFTRKLFQVAIEAAAIKSDLDGICETLAWQFRHKIEVGPFNY